MAIRLNRTGGTSDDMRSSGALKLKHREHGAIAPPQPPAGRTGLVRVASPDPPSRVHAGRQGSTFGAGPLIRIDMIRQDTRHPDKRRRHQGRAWCEVADHRFEAKGPAPIYRVVTLLWLHGHGGAGFEVWDDVSPFGGPGGLAMRGRVRNWASFETPNG